MSNQFKTLQHVSLPTTVPVRPKELQNLRIDPTGGKRARMDYATTLDDLARQARQENASSGPATLATGARSFVLQDVSATLGGIETPTARRLKEAKAKIQARDFAGAIRLLQEVLAEQAAHGEACFLMAECEFGTNLHEAALERLHRLRALGVQAEMATRIGDLCLKISDALWPALFEGCKQKALAGSARAAVDQVQRLVGLCPAAAMLHYLLAMLQMMAGEIEEAARSIDSALRLGRPHEMLQLMRLKDDIGERLAVRRMGQAAELFKAAKYHPARQFLASLEMDVQRSKLCRLFDAFLKECEAGRTDRPAAETLEEAEPLYEFILASEVRIVQTTSSFAEAERTARLAVGWLPQYPFAQFLYARTIYDRLMDEVVSGSPPPLDKLLSDLRISASHAERATVDPGIKSAPEMLEGLNSLIAYFQVLAEQMAQQQREASIVNPVLNEFVALMESAQKGISSLDDLRRARSGLQAVQRKIAPARKQVESEAAVEALQELEDVIQANLKQLDAIEKEIQESELVGTLIKQFNNLLDGLEKGGTSRDRLQSVKTELQSIQGKVPGVRAKITSPEAKKDLQDLERVVKEHLAALESALDAPPDLEIVNALIERFTAITDSLKKKGPFQQPSQTEAMNALIKLKALKADCEKACRKASPKGKEVLDQLINTINDIIPSSF